MEYGYYFRKKITRKYIQKKQFVCISKNITKNSTYTMFSIFLSTHFLLKL